jgi:hypothetical protein
MQWSTPTCTLLWHDDSPGDRMRTGTQNASLSRPRDDVVEHSGTSNTELSPCAALWPPAWPLSAGPFRTVKKEREFGEWAERIPVRPIARQSVHNTTSARNPTRIHCLNAYPRVRIARRTHFAPFPSRSGLVESGRSARPMNWALSHARRRDATIPLAWPLRLVRRRSQSPSSSNICPCF